VSKNYPTSKRAATLLALGALCGFFLAATGLLETDTPEAIDAVATVNDEVISKEDYLTYLSLLAKDKRNPLSEDDRRHVLNRMIEEKLIIERGLDIGLAQSDPNIRKLITSAMIQTITADASTRQADEQTLRDFYQQNQAYFSLPSRLHLQRMIFRSDDQAHALAQAKKAYQQLAAGEDFQSVKQQLASPEVLTIPNSPLPPNKLRQYIGPQLTEAALLMQSGTISQPIEDNSGYTLLYVIANERAQPQPFEDVENLVANEYRRRAGDQILRDYMQRMREQADIRVDEAFLDSLSDIQ
jgi:parvulin-like peptidyl-prolyl isomerase